MSAAVLPFDYNGQQVRTVSIDGEPWFVAADVTRALGISNGRDAVSRLEEDGVGTADVIDSMGRTQSARVLNESALYELIFQSRVSGAVEFRRWVTHDVLPTIRRTGRYGSDADMLAHLPSSELLQIAAAAAKRAEDAEKQIAADRPKVIFADAVATSHTSILVGELAKILRGNGIQIGQRRLFQRLRDEGFLIRRLGSETNMPTQKSMELGLFEIKETAITHADGHVTVSKTPKVTGKGQQYFINRYAQGVAA